VLKGSHHIGRVDHVQSGDQAGADMERVREAMKRYPLVDCVMKPGDALFFHSNLLHASARNDSDKPRWSMICCYNARKNDPYKEAHHPRYTPLKKVPDTMIKKVGLKRLDADRANVSFLAVEKDASATSLKKKLVAK
jgi:ectoine hydroxylase-related dioxygenase (phytanoyl-CoA dioxygenase family)